MALLNWKPARETGMGVSDQQHRQCLGQMESGLVALHEDLADERVLGVLSFLSGYVEQHSSTEEDHGRATQYLGLDGHKAIHDDFRIRAADMAVMFRTELAIVTEEVIDLLTDWRVNPINHEGRDLVRRFHVFQAEACGAEP